MSRLTLTPMAQRAMEYMTGENSLHNTLDDDLKEWIDSISTSNGFWWGLNEQFTANVLVDEAKDRELTRSELIELEMIWSDISWEM